MNRIVFFIIILLTLTGCREEGDAPKPRGFFRIALPEKAYQTFDTIYPYRFEYPVYAEFEPDTGDVAERYWGDIVFPEFNGRIHMSYKPLDDREELAGYFEDARTFVQRHIPKASGIDEETVVYEKDNVYGMLFHIKGREAGSALQFYATDSTDHFLRGALYFRVPPDNDSLAPVINFIEEDIRHLLSTLAWD